MPDISETSDMSQTRDVSDSDISEASWAMLREEAVAVMARAYAGAFSHAHDRVAAVHVDYLARDARRPVTGEERARGAEFFGHQIAAQR